MLLINAKLKTYNLIIFIRSPIFLTHLWGHVYGKGSTDKYKRKCFRARALTSECKPTCHLVYVQALAYVYAHNGVCVHI